MKANEKIDKIKNEITKKYSNVERVSKDDLILLIENLLNVGDVTGMRFIKDLERRRILIKLNSSTFKINKKLLKEE